MSIIPTPNQETIDQFVIFCHDNMAGVREMPAEVSGNAEMIALLRPTS